MSQNITIFAHWQYDTQIHACYLQKVDELAGLRAEYEAVHGPGMGHCTGQARGGYLGRSERLHKLVFTFTYFDPMAHADTGRVDPYPIDRGPRPVQTKCYL